MTLPEIDWEKLKSVFVFEDAKNPLLFNSGAFFLLFLGFMGIFFALRNQHTLRIIFAMAFSLFFYYRSSGEMVLLLVFVGSVDFGLGLAVQGAKTDAQKRAWLVLNAVFNLGILAYFKYRYFFRIAIGDPTVNMLDVEQMVIPAGISFFTFQAMAYSIDIYRGHLRATTSWFEFIFFISYFPHGLAGPIIRANSLVPQLKQSPRVTDEDVAYGLIYICAGLFKKVVIADFISDHVKMVFDDPLRFTGVDCLLVAYAYAILIYADFSGYSDMAIGMSRMLGIYLPPNFNAPYISTSITEFWRRWHISLSTWLRDYLYIPLGGNRKASLASFILIGIFAAAGLYFCLMPALSAEPNWLPLILWGVCVAGFVPLMIFAARGGKESSTGINLLLTMLLGGVWHVTGPTWNYILWGAGHGLALGFEKLLFTLWPPGGNPVRKFLGWLLTFHFVVLLWIFFNAKTFELGCQFVANIFTNFHGEVLWQAISGYSSIYLIVLLGYVLHFTPLKVEAFFHRGFLRSPMILRSFIVAGVIWVVIQFLSPVVKSFIYYHY